MNRGKIFSGIAALLIYILLILTILFFYNIHQVKAKNYVKKNENRVTVTLVNSDKTVLNRSDKSSNTNRPTPPITHPVPLKIPKKVSKKTPKTAPKIVKHLSKHIPKKIVKKVPKKIVSKKKIPKKIVKKVPKKIVPKKKIPKKIVKRVPKKVVPKKKIPKKIVKKVPKKVVPKKKIPKKIVKRVPKKVVPKKKIPKKIPERIVPKRVVKVVPKKRVPKKSAKDLFSSVRTKDIERPIKHRPKPIAHRVEQPRSSIKHSSSVADRIKSSRQAGRSSNANRDKGIENAYIADVKRRLNSWNAAPEHKGKRVTLELTIYNSGKFSYIITKGSGSIRGSLSQYLNQLKRIGLRRHNKSTPYSIKVNYTVR